MRTHNKMSNLNSCISDIKHTFAFELATLEVQVYSKKLYKTKGGIRILDEFQNIISYYIFTGIDNSSTLKYVFFITYAIWDSQ